MPVDARTRFGPYEVVSFLGAGGMGEVYRAHDTRLGRDVALKILPPLRAANPRFRHRFEREARAVAALSHPHICRLHDIGSQNGTDFLVMEYLEGETLERRIVRGPLSIAHVLQYGAELADALHHAHRCGIVHRDVKPSNVMLTKAEAMLLDFGIVKWPAIDASCESEGTAETGGSEDVPDRTLSLTAERALLGTLAYMAPEVLDGRAADSRSDIFAFGCVLYEMTTGHRAFDAPTRGALVASILESDSPPIHTIQPSVPPALERVIAKCLAKDPEKRWQSARDLADELEWIATDQASNYTRATPFAPIHPRTRLPRALAGAGLLAVALLAVAMLAVRSRPVPIVEHPVRFSITPTEGSRFLQGAAFLAVSPDGQHLAYIASVPDGTQRLWIRALDSLDARALAGTDRANQPFWSADGRFVAYMQDGKLKKIDISGGPPQTVTDLPFPDYQGGTWNRDDVIVFASGGLNRVSANGGPVLPVVPNDRQRGEIKIGWPTFLPDGRHFLYRVLSERDEHTGVFLGSLDSSERRRVMSVDSNTAYVEPGYLLYQKEGVLTAQRFDTDRFLPVGDPIVLAGQLTYNRLNGRGSFSASTSGVVAYRQTNEAQLAWFNRHGKMLSSIGEPAFYLELSLSPDGTRIAGTRLDPRTNTSDVVLVDTERGVTSQVTFAPSSEQTPLWSPDGRDIIFSADSDGFFNLFRKPATAEGRDESLFGSASHKRPLDWSRDGRLLVFEQSYTTDGSEGLWTLPLDGSRTPARIPIPTQSNGSSAQLSPDGRWLAWVSRESGEDEIYVQSFPIAGTRRKISSKGGTEPRWRRDMTELFYLAPTGDLMAVPLTRSATLDSGTPRALFRTPFGQLTNITGRKRYDVAPDGERFLMTAPRGGSESAPITVVLNWLAAMPR